MSHTTLIFVNVSRQDAFVSILEADGNALFVAKLAAGGITRQISAVGEKWSVVASDSYQITAGDKNRVYLIGTSGVYEIENARALTAESGASPTDFDFPGFGGGAWP